MLWQVKEYREEIHLLKEGCTGQEGVRCAQVFPGALQCLWQVKEYKEEIQV